MNHARVKIEEICKKLKDLVKINKSLEEKYNSLMEISKGLVEYSTSLGDIPRNLVARSRAGRKDGKI